MPERKEDMEITRITSNNIEGFQNILPPYVRCENNHILGCIVNKKAVATAVMNLVKDNCSISWLWVSPDYRRQGIGGALLKSLCESAAKEYKKEVTITFPTDASWTVVMEYMMLKCGFTAEIHTYPRFCFTKEQLLSSPLMARKESGEDRRVMTLHQVSHLQIKELIQGSKEKDEYQLTESDFFHADRERSMAFVVEGHIQGLVLVGSGDKEGVLTLNLLYLKRPAANAALMLLHHTALNVLSYPAGFREFHFLCTDEITPKICHQLMGKKEAVLVEYCHGRLA